MSRPNLADALKGAVTALPNGAVTVTSTTIDLEVGPYSEFMARSELRVNVPALTTTQLPNGDTLTFNVLQSLDDVTYVVASNTELVVTGAGGVGAGVASFRFRPDTAQYRYLRVQCVKTGAGNCSASNFTSNLVF